MKDKNLRAFSLIELSIVILIVGIIIAGITQSSSLVAKYKLSSARTLTQSSDVNSIRDLLIWVDATKEGSLINSNNSTNVQNGDLITQWGDINPHNSTRNNLTQSTQSSAPTYVENGINNIASIGFDGVNDWFNVPYVLGNLSSNSYTIFMVAQSRVEIPSANIFFLSTQQPQRIYIHHDVTTGTLTARLTSTERLLTPPSFRPNQPFIALLSYDSVSDVHNFKVNNFSTLTVTAPFSGAAASMTMGGFNQGLSNFCNCLIGEFMIYDRILNTDERSAIFSYLSKKWGIRI